MASLGFDGLFFGRLDYGDKEKRLKDKTAEFVWRGSPRNLGKPAELFTHVLFNHYSPPPGFCFDLLCDDEPFIDDKHSPDYNVDKRVSFAVPSKHVKNIDMYRFNNLWTLQKNKLSIIAPITLL
jgi:lysosomal alpha-mannosidase